jgi:hypothetical protein
VTTVYRANNLLRWKDVPVTKPAKLTRHAQMRRKQMRVTEDQITAVLLHPETVYPGGNTHPGGRTCYQRGPLVVVVDTTGEVVTILTHRAEGRS